MDETKVYMAIQVSKQFELEKEWLTIDNYYDSITSLALDYKMQEYNGKYNNMGLLEGINNYINDNLEKIKNVLITYKVSETKNWEVNNG